MPCNHNVIIATQQRQLQTEEPPKVNECAAVDCNRRICVAHSRRMLCIQNTDLSSRLIVLSFNLPDAQHRHNDVQGTYKLQQRGIHHQATPSRPNRIKSNPARKAAIQASMYVSTVIKVESESNLIQPAGQHAHHYHGVIRIPYAVRDSDLYSIVDGCQ